MGIIDDQRYADYLDSMADADADLESDDDDDTWYDNDLSSEEVNACDHYNERYVMPYFD